MNFTRLSALVPGILVAASCSAASIGINPGPLADATRVTVDEVLVGDTLTGPSQKAEPLFGTDFKRAAAFEALLRKKIQERLQKAGLIDGEGAAHSLSFGLFGGRFEVETCDKRTFFMLALRVGAPTDKVSSVERTRLGAAGDSDLESSLLRVAMEALDEVLAQRERARSASPALNRSGS
jgi:hypothetical protein